MNSDSTSAIAAATGFISFAVFGFCLSIAPSHFAVIAGTDSRLIIGLLCAITLGASALVQLIPLRGAWRTPVGLGALALALLGIAAAGSVGSTWFLVLACSLAGAGQGIAFQAVFTAATAAVDPGRHASTVNAIYTVTYLGSTAPVLGLGALAEGIGLSGAVALFAGALALACAALAALTLAAGRRGGARCAAADGGAHGPAARAESPIRGSRKEGAAR